MRCGLFDYRVLVLLLTVSVVRYRARFYRLRQSFEKSRILCDLVQRREVLKQQVVQHFADVQTLLEQRAAENKARAQKSRKHTTKR